MAVEEAVAFGCSSCAAHFLRGAFLCAGSVSDPRRTHHLEFRLPDDGRAVCLADLCAACGMEPGITHRDGQCGIFFKRVESICDMLTRGGARDQLGGGKHRAYRPGRAAPAERYPASGGEPQAGVTAAGIAGNRPSAAGTRGGFVDRACGTAHPANHKIRTESQTPENHTGGGGAVNASISQQRSGTGKACAAPVFFWLVGLIRRKLLRVPQIRIPLPSICRERGGVFICTRNDRFRHILPLNRSGNMPRRCRRTEAVCRSVSLYKEDPCMDNKSCAPACRIRQAGAQDLCSLAGFPKSV